MAKKREVYDNFGILILCIDEVALEQSDIPPRYLFK